MTYQKTGPFVSGGAPGIDAGFLNNVEDALVNLNVVIQAADVQDFIASGTWTKPDGARYIVVEIISAGGGGHIGGTSSGGGDGGNYYRLILRADALPETVSVVVGAGGTAGVSGVNSGQGTTGGSSSFGDFIVPGGAGSGSFPPAGLPIHDDAMLAGGDGAVTSGQGSDGIYGAGGGGGSRNSGIFDPSPGGLGGTSGDPGALKAGNGGAGEANPSTGRVAAQDGEAPGGGGGGACNWLPDGAGDGARGQVRATTYF